VDYVLQLVFIPITCITMYTSVRGYAWIIITGFGLDDWTYWCFYYNYTMLQSLITAHNWWLPNARSISSGLRASSLPRWLTNYTPGWILTAPFHDGFGSATDCQRPSLSFIILRHYPHRKHINCPATDILCCCQACLAINCVTMDNLLLSRA
jgi:hypothetical protein